MTIDEDFVRNLLLRIEAHPNSSMVLGETFGYSRDEKTVHHVAILIDDGLLAETGASSYRITAEGHRFLSAIRDEGIWEQTKSAVAETGGSASLDIFKKLATGFLKAKISKHTGIDF